MTKFSVPMPPRSSIRRGRGKPKPDVIVGNLGIIRLHGAALERLRRDCFTRDKGVCQQCAKTLRYYGWVGGSDVYHMAHIGNKRMYGDALENVRCLCGDCHRAEHGNPKGGRKNGI